MLALLLTGFAQAQTVPDAGSIQQQIEKERGIGIPMKPSVPTVTPSPQPPPKASAGATVTVTAFRFAGNRLLPESQLASAVKGYLNHPVDFAELQNAAADVAAAYRQAGWIARAYLPRQDITEGIVTIQIVEAVFGEARIAGNPPLRLKIDTALRMVNDAQAKGAPVNADSLDRALLLMNDLPGISVAGNLAEGQQKNETDLILKLSDGPMFNGTITADNAGARSTGSERLAGSLYVNSPLGLGDQLSAYLVHSEGEDYGQLSASLPLGAEGWRGGVNASTLSYALVSPEFASLDARGTSSTLGLEASYPIIRSRQRNLFISLNIDDKRFNNKSAGTTLNDYGIDTYSAKLSGNLFDTLGGGGANTASLALTQGQVDLDGSPNQAADATSTQTAGSFTKLRYGLSRQQFVTNDISLYGMLAGQWTSRNLDSAEKFYQGGANGVRAYPANEGAGSEGQLVNIELRWRMPRNITMAGFYDWGHVRVNHDNDFPGAATLNGYSLRGGGISLNWFSDFGLTLSGMWAHRIGSNPNPTANGRDQDGSLMKNRFWLQATQAF